jgi:hypothetical protein
MNRGTELRRAVRAVLDLENKLSLALSNLSSVATEIYGEDLQADLCGGSEIEFRRRGDDGYFDALDCVRIEDIEKRL